MPSTSESWYDLYWWQAVGGGTNSSVLSFAYDQANDNLYVGGEFTQAGVANANRVAKWNGSTWEALGAGSNFHVDTLTFDGTNLYAGGGFSLGTFSYCSIWNGSFWARVTDEADNNLNGFALASTYNSSDSAIYVGGGFPSIGTVDAVSIAKWDGTNWISLEAGTNGTVFSLAFDSANNLFAGGGFTTAGGVTANNIAKWDGSIWTSIESATVNGVNGAVRALLFDDVSQYLYVGGSFSTAGPDVVNRVVATNGVSWTGLGNGFNSTVYSFAKGLDQTIYCGGEFTFSGAQPINYISRFVGSAWEEVGGGMDGSVRALLTDKHGNIYAGGEFTTAGGVPCVGIAKWGRKI